MKLKLIFSFLFAGALFASAQQGYKDGIEYFRADQPEEAEMILNRTINEPSTDKAEAYYYLGLIELGKGNVTAAADYFNKGVAANAENPYNYVGLGSVSLKNGNKDDAEDKFKQAKSFNKKDPKVITEVARAYFRTDPALYSKEIEKNIKEALKVAKKDREPAIYILQGDIAAPTNVGDAAGLYEMAQSFDPETKYPEAYVKYARTYFSVNPQYSIDKLKALLEKVPNSALAQRELAEKYYESDRLTLAAEQYGKYIANPNHFKKDEIRYVALLYFGKKYQESFDLAGKILSEDPTNIYMQRMQFLNQEALGNHQEARTYAEKFFANPKVQGNIVANDYTTYGDVLSALGNDSIAAEQFEKAYSIAPEKTAILKDLSGIYTKAKMYKEAANAMQRFVDAGDATTNDIFMLSRRYQNAAAVAEPGSAEREEAVTKALKNVDIAIERAPENATVALTKARILFVKNNNEPDQATVDAYLNAIALLDKDPENVTKRKNDYINAYNQIANFHLKQGDNENARLYFTKFLEIDPTNDALREFLEKNLK